MLIQKSSMDWLLGKLEKPHFRPKSPCQHILDPFRAPFGPKYLKTRFYLKNRFSQFYMLLNLYAKSQKNFKRQFFVKIGKLHFWLILALFDSIILN